MLLAPAHDEHDQAIVAADAGVKQWRGYGLAFWISLLLFPFLFTFQPSSSFLVSFLVGRLHIPLTDIDQVIHLFFLPLFSPFSPPPHLTHTHSLFCPLGLMLSWHSPSLLAWFLLGLERLLLY